MNVWIIAAIVIGFLAFAGIMVSITSLTTANQPEEISCEGCGNNCNADKNCGRASCGAVNSGSCGCGG